jgi:hypothetical protein
MLKSMGPQAKMLVIERTAEFIDTLDNIDDPRLEVVHGCASTVSEELAQEIIVVVQSALAPGGRLVAHQFTDRVAEYAKPIMGCPKSRSNSSTCCPLGSSCATTIARNP